MADRYFATDSGSVARERVTESTVEHSIYNPRLRRFVRLNSIITYISGIGGEPGWDPITRDEAAAIIAQLNREHGATPRS